MKKPNQAQLVAGALEALTSQPEITPAFEAKYAATGWTMQFKQAVVMISCIKGLQPNIIEKMENELVKLRRQLLEEADTMLEVMLTDHVLFCQTRLSVLNLYCQQLNVETTTPAMLIEHFERRINNVQKRYLRACENLARVRKLLRRPKAQLNIGTLNAALLAEAPAQAAAEALRQAVQTGLKRKEPRGCHL